MHRPIHFEILTNDAESVGKFYEQVFGWKVASWGGDQPYWLVTTGEEGTPGINGGIMGKHLEQSVINTHYVASMEEALSKVEAAGGKKVHGPQEVPGAGLHAYCADPTGVLFGIMQPIEQTS